MNSMVHTCDAYSNIEGAESFILCHRKKIATEQIQQSTGYFGCNKSTMIIPSKFGCLSGALFHSYWWILVWKMYILKNSVSFAKVSTRRCLWVPDGKIVVCKTLQCSLDLIVLYKETSHQLPANIINVLKWTAMDPKQILVVHHKIPEEFTIH